MHLTSTRQFGVSVLTPLIEYRSPRGDQAVDYAGSFSLSTSDGSLLICNTSLDQKHGLFYNFIYEQGYATLNALTGRIQIESRLEEKQKEPHYRYGETFESIECCYPTEDNVTATAMTIHAFTSGQSYPTFADSLIASDIIRSIIKPSQERSFFYDDYVFLSDFNYIANWA